MRISVALFPLLLVLVAVSVPVGCGQGSATSDGVSATADGAQGQGPEAGPGGSLTLRVRFPESSARLIPSMADEVMVSLFRYDTTSILESATTTPSSPTAEFTGYLEGMQVMVAAMAFADTGAAASFAPRQIDDTGSGSLAFGIAGLDGSLAIPPAGETITVHVAMESLIETITVDPPDSTIDLDAGPAQVELRATAYDADAAIVLTNPDMLVWAIESEAPDGAGAAAGRDVGQVVSVESVDGTGVVTGIAPGQAVVSVTDSESGIAGYATVEVVGSAPASGGLAESAWPMFGMDLRHTRRSPYIGAQTNGLKWSFATGESVWSSAAIAEDGTVYIGSFDDYLYAVNPDGTEKWRFATGSYVAGGPAVGADGTVYFGSGDRNVYAANPDGTERWRFLTMDVETPGVASSPAIGTDGTVYVGSYDYNLYAINPDGSLKWSFMTGGAVHSSPAIDADGTVYVGSSGLYAINPGGTEKWHIASGFVDSSPAIGADGTVYVGNGDYLYAVNPDGTEKWSLEWLVGCAYSSPAIGADGTVYIGSDWGDSLAAIGP